MLGITLLQYSKFLKNISVNGIYYGAFENLGFPREISEKYPNPNDRKVPLLNLTAFSLLQDWTIAANNFINLGNAKMMKKLTLQGVNPILAATKGKDKTARKLRNLADELAEFSSNLRVNRGANIMDGASSTNAKNILNQIDDYELIPPFKPIVDNIEETLESYSEKDVFNLFKGVEWCIDKQLIQEGITQLQEGTITFLAVKQNWDYKDKPIRNLISSYLSVRFHKSKEKWTDELGDPNYQKNVEALDKIENIKKICGVYSAISQKRNDINHGGFSSNSPADGFERDLKNSYEKIIKYFKLNNAY